jgi:hypothetical protein
MNQHEERLIKGFSPQSSMILAFKKHTKSLVQTAVISLTAVILLSQSRNHSTIVKFRSTLHPADILGVSD